MAILLIADWVWKGKARWSGLSFGTLVDVGCGLGWRKIISNDALEGDILERGLAQSFD